MNFAYFIPVSRDNLKPADITNAGLHDTLRDRMTQTDLSGLGRLVVASVTNGPGGQDGTFLQCLPEIEPDEPQPVGYFQKTQTWIDCGKYWLGYDATLPTADDLKRDKLIGGWDVTLETGETYHCPTIRMRDAKSNLPDVWRLISGKLASVTKPSWAWAWDLSGEIWDWFVTQTDVPTDKAFEWCVKLVGINYRIGPNEASVLGLFGADCYPEVLRSAINGQLIDWYMQKKSEAVPTADTANSCVGVGSY